MRGPSALCVSFVWTFFFAASLFHHAAAYTPSNFYPQGFLFDWNPPGTALPIPLTQQCETLHIAWERGSTGVGPNPVSPYFLQVFTSVYTVPIIIPAGSGSNFDFQVPFSPGTQYQICMVDSTGVAGGCQDIYTMVPNTNASVTCPNVTVPTSTLQVDAAVINGAFAQYGWIPQCTDIRVQAQNGTGPYTLTVAPTLHPPLNITTSNGPINWTVSFTHGFPFFIALTDSQGNSWSRGPLHSGDNLDTTCLDTSHLYTGHKSSSVPVAVGAGVGGVAVGLLAGTFAILMFKRCRGSRSRKVHREDLIHDGQLSSDNSQQSREVPVTAGTGNVASGLEYIVEPFAVPPGTPGSPPGGQSDPLLQRGNVASPIMSRTDAMSTTGVSEPGDSSGRRGTRNVYVVHHDGGQAPVTVYADEDAEVVELPPRYAAGSSSAPSETASSRGTDRRGSTRKNREPTTPRT